ncbi:hypothetical protein RFI_31754, partial [Reticulomyxa filosa]
ILLLNLGLIVWWNRRNKALEQGSFGKGINLGGVIHFTENENKTEVNYKRYKRAAMQLKRKLRQEKQEYLIKSIESSKEENTRKLFSQFKSMNSNKVSIISTLELAIRQIAKTDQLLVSWFSQRIIIVSTVTPIIYHNIVHSVQDPIQCGMFADDVALWSSIYTSDEKEMERQLDLMQTSLDNVSLWHQNGKYPIDHVQDKKQKEIS